MALKENNVAWLTEVPEKPLDGRVLLVFSRLVRAFFNALAEFLGRGADRPCQLRELGGAKKQHDNNKYHYELWAPDVLDETEHVGSFQI